MARIGACLGFIVGALVALPVLLLAHWQLAQTHAQEASRYGAAIVEYVSAFCAEPLVTRQPIALNLILARTVDDPAVAGALVKGLDGQLIDTVGADVLAGADAAQFEANVVFQGDKVGVLRLLLNQEAFGATTTGWLLLLAGLCAAAISAAIGMLLGAQLGRRIGAVSAAVAPLLHHTALSAGPAAGNELAQLEYSLQSIEADAVPEPGQLEGSGLPPYLIVINVFNQISLSQDDRQAVVNRSIRRIERVCRLYNGRVEVLPGTGLVAMLDAAPDDDHAFQAICAAILMGKVVSDLNHHRYREGRRELLVRIGLSRVPGGSVDLSRDQSFQDQLEGPIHDTVILSATARNDAIAMGRDVFETVRDPDRLKWQALRTPSVAEQSGSRFCYLTSDVADDYEPLLQRQVELLLAGPPGEG